MVMEWFHRDEVLEVVPAPITDSITLCDRAVGDKDKGTKVDDE